MTRRRHPKVDIVDVLEPSPLIYALGDVGRQRLHKIVTLPPPPKKEDPAMSNPPYVQQHELQRALKGLVTEAALLDFLTDAQFVNRAELDGAMRAVTSAIQAVNDRIDSLYASVAELGEQVLAATSNRTDVPDRVVRFLESHPGIKFSPTSIAENLSIDRADQVCRRLSTAGRISIDNKPGHRPLYFVKG